ncbi:vWA domain-containing protein [Vreelandella sp. 21]|uniref:vWA domain-containing protein n=1 Tax=Vreelandella sp. 21 TaxID=3402864 RepID=UPI003D9A78CD
MRVTSSTVCSANSLKNAQANVERCVFLLVLLAVIWPARASAYPQMVFVQTPNDTVEQAQPFRGEARLVGEVYGDNRDLFRWSLDDAETDRLWHLELQGDGESELDAELFWPGEKVGSTSGVATFGADPVTEVSEDKSLLTLSAAPRNDRVVSESLIVPAGEHLIRFLPKEAGGAYRLTLTSGDRINIRGTVGPDDADDIAVEPGRQWYFQLNVADVTIPLISEGDSHQLWRVALFGELGAAVEAWITDADGEMIAEAVEGSPLQQQWGRLDLPEGSQLHVRHTEGSAIGRLGASINVDGMRRDELAAEDVAAKDEKEEETPFAGSPETRHWVGEGEVVSLTMARNERRYLAFTAAANQALTLGVSAEDIDAQLEVCLSAVGSHDDICRTGLSETLFSQMTLPDGDYGLALRHRSREPATYTLSLHSDKPAPEGWVSRPNDAREWALPLTAGSSIHGHFDGSQEAWFALQVTGETQQWAISTEGELPLERLTLYQDGENSAFLDNRRPRRGNQNLWLEHVRLLPGRYLIRLVGEDTDYRLLASPTGKPQPGFEQEPNDDDRDANPLWLGEPVQGTFHSSSDHDRFHFHLPGHNRVVFELDPPEGSAIEMQLEWQGERRFRLSGNEGERVRIDPVLPPGDYIMLLQGEEASRSRYKAQVSITDPWTHEGMPMPAERPEEAPMLPEDAVISRQMGGVSSSGGFLRLPVTEGDRDVYLEGRVRSLGGAYTGLAFRTNAGDVLEVADAEGRGRHVVTIPGSEAVTLEVSFGRASRSVTISDPAYPLPETPSLEGSLETAVQRLPPFASTWQRLGSRLILRNPGEEQQTLTLDSHVSHDGATVSGLPEEIELAPGELRELPLTWMLPPNMLVSSPLSLFVRAGEQVLRQDLALDPQTAPVAPFTKPDVPAPLQGLANLAWGALGATFVDPDSGEPIDDLSQRRHGYSHFLLDGMAGSGSSIQVASDIGDALPPIRLAGEGGRVLGIAFNQRSTHDHGDRWREVEVALGSRHGTLEVVETVELGSGDGEQFFELETPHDARYIQLRPLSVWGDEGSRRRTHGSGLLRVLGEPEGELAQRRHDLLDHELGGHWVYTRPDISSLYGFQGQRYTARGIMGERQVRRGQRIRGRTIEMVFAFLHQRAARIDELQWIENLDWEGQPVERVRVYTATESPVGPWERQADWTLERDAEGVANLPLPDSPRVRYLRLVFDEPEEGEGRRENTWRIPERLSAYEADSLGNRRSVLGHWGMDHSRGPLEAEQPPVELSLIDVEDAHSHVDAPLMLERRVTGRVEEPRDARHYRVDLEEGDNTLAFALQESLRGRLQASLTDHEGTEVPLAWQYGEGGQRFAEVVDLAPGTYRLVVAEPPRSVAILWDGSGSVASHQPAIYQALNRFAEVLKPGREVFNMLPLGGPLLIDGWAESPIQVAQTLNAYSGRFSSSDSEPALKRATRALEHQDGEKVIFLITDAEQLGRDMSVWRDLERVRPRIFTLEITHGSRRDTDEYRWYQDQMLSWANVGGGRYRYTTGRSDLIRAFEEGMRELRQPTTFALEVDRRYQEPPKPGSLRVVRGDEPVVAAGVVHLIFDASGSMLRQMEGGRRIEVARRIVQQVLDERIPQSVPVALRAFGHTEPHSCATELLVAPGDDNHAQVRRAVEGIQAINLARTPLADSLDAVLDDLTDYQGQRRLVVMLTDGEETCDGDLEQSVAHLIEEGIDVRLNIVGFHIDEIGLQAEFERFAELGGGEYFDSHDGDELIESLASALAATWRVLDAAGGEVARGRVGDDPIELDVGEYELVVETQAGIQRQTFDVGPRQSVEVQLGEEGQ